MENNKHDKLISIILIVYVLSIFLDLHIFYNSISTLIRCMVATGLFIFAFIRFGNRKERKWLIIYFVLYGIFIILHLFNINNNSIIAELLYFYKMLVPIFVIYTVSKLKIDLKDFYKILNICILIISGSIVLCNLIEIGYSAYDFYHVKHSIFEWFTNNDLSYIKASSKGFFHFTNQLVAVLLLYLPLLINQLKEKTNVLNTVTLILSLLSLLMLGNRLSSITPLIIMVTALVIYFILWITKKEKFNHKFIALLFIIMGGYFLILSKSPLVNRYEYYDEINAYARTNEKTTRKLIKKVESEEEYLSSKQREKDIRRIFNEKLININFPLYYYPYYEDKEFWDHMLRYDSNILYNARFIEKSIIKRVVELNDNKIKDKLFGIGYDRIMNIQNIEQDYIMQYYSIGIIGTILCLGIYVVLYLYMAFKLLFNIDRKFKFSILMLMTSLIIVMLSAYFSGNILNATSTMIPLSFVMGIALNEMNKNDNEYPNKILGFNVCNGSKESLVREVLNSKTQNIIFNINPLIVANFYNSDAVKIFNEQKYNIPDGSGIMLASKIKQGSINKQISGIEVVESICKKAKNKKIYLYGSKDGVANKAKENLEQKYKVNIVGVSNGYIKESDALKDILIKKPDILFVALGSPKQESFIINNQQNLKNINVIMPVGGSLDVISGNTKRAPIIWSKLHLEWLYRMIKEPKRIKQNLGIIKYLWLMIFKNDKYNKKSK